MCGIAQLFVVLSWEIPQLFVASCILLTLSLLFCVVYSAPSNREMCAADIPAVCAVSNKYITTSYETTISRAGLSIALPSPAPSP